MNLQINKTRFLPPNTGIIWENKRLMETFDTIDKYPITFVKANFGYGKTANLVYYLKNKYRSNYSWCKLDNIFYDSQQFMTDIINSFKYSTMETEELEEVINIKNTTMGIKQFFIKIFNILVEKKQEQMFLVLDDFHKVKNKNSIYKLICSIIDLIPPFFHIIICNRNNVSSRRIISWQIAGKVNIIEEEKYKLDLDDIGPYLKNQYNLKLNCQKINKIYRISEGWILALNLIGESIKRGHSL